MILSSFAKINLGLEVKNKRPDGFHDVDMIVQRISLCDFVHFHKIKKTDIIVSCSRNVCDEKSNLAYKVAKTIFDEINPSFGVEIYIEKNIPTGAGLGGGSSNSAAVILAFNKIFNLNLSNQDILNISLKFGSDVPLFSANGTLRCQGRGEILTKVKSIPDCKILIKNTIKKSFTSDAYKKLDSLRLKNVSNEKIENLRLSLESKKLDNISKHCFNDFENIINVPSGWHLTGSGSYMFKIVEKNFTNHDNNIISCYPVDCGVKIIENNWN